MLGACASTPPVDNVSNSDENPVLTSLPPQNLNLGECGLFIWSGGENRDFIGFESQTGVKLLNKGRMVVARRQEANGLEAEKRIYEFGEGESIALTLRKDADIAEGQRFFGRFTSKTDDGWDRVLPVIAILSCLQEGASET